MVWGEIVLVSKVEDVNILHKAPNDTAEQEHDPKQEAIDLVKNIVFSVEEGKEPTVLEEGSGNFSNEQRDTIQDTNSKAQTIQNTNNANQVVDDHTDIVRECTWESETINQIMEKVPNTNTQHNFIGKSPSVSSIVPRGWFNSQNVDGSSGRNPSVNIRDDLIVETNLVIFADWRLVQPL